MYSEPESVWTTFQPTGCHAMSTPLRRTIESMNCLCNRPGTLHTDKGREMVALCSREAVGLPRASRKEDGMTTQQHQVTAKILVSAAIALGFGVGGAAAASADAIGTDPNPFGALTCSCQEIASPRGPALREEMDWGIRRGLSASPGHRSLS